MKLPNGQDAIVDRAKIRDYCLNPGHLRGAHKARVFRSALDIGSAQTEEFIQILRQAAVEQEVAPGISDFYGIRYIIDFEWQRANRSAWIRSIWMIRTGELLPRLLTCYVL